MHILKFGGSSVADGDRMLNVINILKNAEHDKIIVVLSACKGITDKLEKAANYAKNGDIDLSHLFANEISNHHLAIIDTCFSNDILAKQAKSDVKNYIFELKNLLEGIYLLNELTVMVKDSIFSFGELLSSKIFHYLCLDKSLENNWIDARKIIVTDSNFNAAFPLSDKISEAVENILLTQFNEKIAITQGFIGSDLLSRTTTLGRGGSDLTAALLGAALHADEIQIWTDVDGILSADPNIVKNARTINDITYSEVKDLSFWGAKVLHPKTIFPAIDEKIPVKILNSFNATSNGTLILPANNNTQMQIHSIIAKKQCGLMKINITNGNNLLQMVVNEVNHAIESNKLQLLYAAYSNSNLVVLFEFSNKISNYLQNNIVENITYNEEVAVVCITGQNFKNNLMKINADLSNLLSMQSDIKIYQLLYVFSDTSVLLVVDESQADRIVRHLHDTIINF